MKQTADNSEHERLVKKILGAYPGFQEQLERRQRGSAIGRFEVATFVVFLAIEGAILFFLDARLPTPLPVDFGLVPFAFATLVGAYLLTCVVVGGTRSIRDLYYDSGLTVSRYALEIGKWFVFLIGTIWLLNFAFRLINWIQCGRCFLLF